MFTRGLNAVGEGAALIDITFEPVSSNRSLCCGFVPNVRESLYSNIIVTLAVEPQAAVGKDDELPVATGLPRTWDEIAPGHLVIAQEALDHGWWEAIVLGRTGDMFTLRFRDYPKLPRFVRHRAAIALMSPPAE